MLKSRLFILLMFGCLSVINIFSAKVEANERDDAIRSAQFLLRDCLHVSRDGRHARLLLALRHLKDKELTPLFSELAQSDNPVLKIHGLLGLAETSTPPKLDLVRVAAIENPSVQAQIISLAMESDLIDKEQIRQLLNWPGLDNGIKVLAVTSMVKDGTFNKPEILDKAIASKIMMQVAWAHVLKAHLGDAASRKALVALNSSTDPKRDRVRAMILESALQYDLKELGPWALTIATEANTTHKLTLPALKTAIRFDVPQAATVWRQKFNASKGLANKTRLAIIAVREAAHLKADLFDLLINDRNPLLQHIGKAGAAIASNVGIVDAIKNIVAMSPPSPITNQWILRYLDEDATSEIAEPILISLVTRYNQGPTRFRKQFLMNATDATILLAEKYPAIAAQQLKLILSDTKTDTLLKRAILFGLINAKSDQAYLAVKDIKTPKDITLRDLILLLRARQGMTLSKTELTELAMIVRGGIGSDSLRIQAAWVYLKIIGKTQFVLSAVLGD